MRVVIIILLDIAMINRKANSVSTAWLDVPERIQYKLGGVTV